MELWIFDKKRGRRSILSTSGDAHPLAPLPGADSPYQGEMSRRDKRGRDAGSAKPRLRGCRRSAGKDPNRKFSLRFGKEETSTEEKRRRLRRLVPSWSFLTRLRRPYLFSRERKDRGEKSAWMRLVHSASDFRQTPSFWMSFHSEVTSRASWCAPPDTMVPNLQLVALEQFPSNRRYVGNPDGCYLLAGQIVGAGLSSARG